MAEIPTSPLHIPEGVNPIDITCHVASNAATWLQPAAIVVGFIAAIAASIITRCANIGISRKKSTIDVIISENNDTFISRRKKYIEVRDKGNMQNCVDDSNLLEDRTVILCILNQYEAICVGINNGSYCEKTYKDWSRSTLVKDWIDLGAFVSALRAQGNGNRSNVFEEYAKLAFKWATDEEKRRFCLTPRS